MTITKSFIKIMLMSTSLLASQVNAAAPFSPEVQPLGYIGPLELSNTDLTNGAKAYRGWFENGGWQGDLIEYSVSSSGRLTTTIDLSGGSPAQSAGGSNWSALVQLKANAASTSHWDTGRKIVTSTSGTNQVGFRWSKLTDAQKQALDSVAFGDSATSSNILDFLRGDRSQEKPSGNLRLRYTVLGDIVHSNPEYVGAPEGAYSSAAYVAFRNANLTRAPRIYVGANDGMLHAFNASNGNEVWAYVPSMVMSKMTRLAGTPYAHTYFVDGGITVLDAVVGSAWRTVLAGSMGAGAKGLFGLDVTDPNMTSEAGASGGNKKVLWELNAASNDDVGYIFDATTITQLNDGKWYAINGNGVSSVNGIAKLFLVDISSGVVTTISTTSGSTGSPNGLSAPALLDIDKDGKADVAYAGDIDGDMWKFDLTSSTKGNWKLDYKLYNGSSGQPITLAPDIANHPQFGQLVLFGTGRLYHDDDILDGTVQAMYGIWDTGSSPTGSETRLAQLLSGENSYSGGGFSETVRTFTTTATLNYSTHKGWKVDLPAGQRSVTPPQLRAGRLKATITDPVGFENWLLEVTFDEGGVANSSIYDLDRSGVLNTADRVDGNADTDVDDAEDIPMAWKRPNGNMSQATIASLSAGVDTLFLNFLNPPLVPPACSGDCQGGLSGGHMDVDTDTASLEDGLGLRTDGHVHEYDNTHNRTYIDYFDIGGNPLSNVDESGFADTEKFIVLMANGDLSPGGVITIDKKSYNVVEYQRIIHKALAGWDGVSTLKDPDGTSLIHSLKEIMDGGGELKSTFDNQAIIAGGLLPTIYNCVIYSNNLTNGRWRNGSLTFHLVKASHFSGLGGSSALDRVRVQTPSDLKQVVVLANGEQVELTEDLDTSGSIDGTSPDYEIYGGLTANSNSEFLYESIVFWHWAPDPCYGEAGWEDEFELATEGLTEEAYAELLNEKGFSTMEELALEIESLESCKNRRWGGCKQRYSDLEHLYNIGIVTENKANGGGTGGGDGDGGDGGGGGGISGEPVVIDGGVSEGGVTSGPNFETGRRTWIDVLPK